MKERPILFNGAMVRALLDGSKTQTRRVMKPQPEPTPADYPGPAGHWWPSNEVQSMVHVEQAMQNKHGGWGGFVETLCPYGQPGDRLWVRETWADLAELSDGNYERQAIYRADDIEMYGDEDEPVNVTAPDMRWRPSIHMPRWASRILLEIVSVRVERLQDISEDDAKAEGAWPDPSIVRKVAEHFKCDIFSVRPSLAYRMLWESINGAGSWDANPWVWVVEFKRVTP
jgi:hypothetical protein